MAFPIAEDQRFAELSNGELEEYLCGASVADAWEALGVLTTRSGGLSSMARFLGSDAQVLAEPEIRRRVAAALAQFPRESVEEVRAERLEPPSVLEREVFADYYGLIADASHLSDVADLFLGEDTVAIWAALAFAKIGSSSVAVIERLLESEQLSEVKLAYLVDALGRIDDSEARSLLAQILAMPDMAHYAPFGRETS